jgi:hypothetical protein
LYPEVLPRTLYVGLAINAANPDQVTEAKFQGLIVSAPR